MIVVDLLMVLLVTLGVIVGLVLLVPLSFGVEGAATDDRLRGHARVAWGFGLLALRVDQDGATLRLVGLPIVRRRFGDPRPRRRKAQAQKKKKKTEAKNHGEPLDRASRGLFWFLARRHLLTAIGRRYLKALHLRGGIDGVVGLASPEDTARLHQVLTLADRLLPEGALAIELDWVEEVVDLEARFGGWVWPLRIVGLTLWLWLDRKTWRALRAA